MSQVLHRKRLILSFLISYLAVSNVSFITATNFLLGGFPDLSKSWNFLFLTQSYLFSVIPFGKGLAILTASFWFELLFISVAIMLTISTIRKKGNGIRTEISSYLLLALVLIHNIAIFPLTYNASVTDPEYLLGPWDLNLPIVFLNWANFHVMSTLALVIYYLSKRMSGRPQAWSKTGPKQQ